MKNNFLKFFIIFFLLFFIILLLYLSNLSIKYFLSQYLKIIFAFTYSIFIAIYFSYFILFNSKKGKFFLFFSFLFIIGSLSNLKSNIFNFILPEILKNKYLYFVEILFFILSLIFVLISDYIQIKSNSNFKKKKEEDDIFI